MSEQMPHDWSEPLIELHQASIRLGHHYNNKEYSQAEKEIKAMNINLIWLEFFAKSGRIKADRAK